MTVRTPSTPASKTDRTPVSTPGGSRVKEEKIVVTVRLRPLSKKEQSAKDQVAWDCIDDHTIVFKPPPQERSPQLASFTFGILLTFLSFSRHLIFLKCSSCMFLDSVKTKCGGLMLQIKSLVLLL